MTNIKIMRLVLENFKCHRHLVLELSGENRTIYGDNATGKTSVYDALTWLLFGKDSSGNGEKNIEIKPLDAAGNVADHQAITCVEAELLCRGMCVWRLVPSKKEVTAWQNLGSCSILIFWTRFGCCRMPIKGGCL